MKTVTLEVASPRDAMAGFATSWRRGKADRSARIVFATAASCSPSTHCRSSLRCARRSVPVENALNRLSTTLVDARELGATA